jgi:hypothetical protein
MPSKPESGLLTVHWLSPQATGLGAVPVVVADPPPLPERPAAPPDPAVVVFELEPEGFLSSSSLPQLGAAHASKAAANET